MVKKGKLKNHIVEKAVKKSLNKSFSCLSKIIGKQVKVNSSTINFIYPNKIEPKITNYKDTIVATYTKIKGDAFGNMLIVFPKESGLLLADLLKKEELGTTKLFASKERMLFKKLGKTIAAFYISSLVKSLNIKASVEKPIFVSIFDPVKDFLFFQTDNTEKLLFKNANFNIGEEIKGNFVSLLAIK